MNYANMIEEKQLKKGFIIATLISTIVGTFTASMTLHDKVSEKRNKKAQAKTDGKQNDELKELKEKIEKLEGGGGGDKKDEQKPKEEDKDKDKGNDDKKSHRSRSRSRSRSSSRRRRRRDSMDRSRALIEQTYANHLMRVGDRYAEGDLITENKLQAQVIQMQKTVIDVLQNAVQSGRGLTEADMDKIMTAQNAARDGSLGALNGQYQRMITEQEAPAPKPWEERAPAPKGWEERPAPKPWEERPPPSRRPSEAPPRSPEMVYAQSRRGPAAPPQPDYPDARRASSYQPIVPAFAVASLVREPSVKGRSPPGPSRKDSVHSDPIKQRAADAGPRRAGSDQPRAAEQEGRPQKAGSNGQNERPKSRVGRPEPAPPPDKDDKKAPSKAPDKNDKKAPSKAPDKKDDQKKPDPKKDEPKKAASKPPAPQESKIVHPSSVSSPPSAPRSAQPARAPMKALPAPVTTHSPFCRYALDLQTNPLPLHHNFRSSGSQRCPACGITIPVNSRDVWVFSLASPNPSKPPRDYRMDARFVAKCHASGGGFACLLCERHRDLDCFCRSVDALVKHLGSAHSAEEFEGDGDLVRMKKGSGVNVGGREMVLA